MKLSSLLAASVLAGLSNAKVVFPKEFRDFTCDTMRFDRQDNQNAADAAYQHRNDPIGPGKRQYPHYFGNSERIGFEPQCRGLDLMEFPLEHLTTWNGMRNAGKYRVVVAFDGNGDTLYCGAMFHRGSDSKFTPCPWRG